MMSFVSTFLQAYTTYSSVQDRYDALGMEPVAVDDIFDTPHVAAILPWLFGRHLPRDNGLPQSFQGQDHFS